MHSVTYQAIGSGKYDGRLKAIQDKIAKLVFNPNNVMSEHVRDRLNYALHDIHEVLTVSLTEPEVRSYLKDTIGLTELNQLSKDIIGEFNARQDNRRSDNLTRTNSSRVTRDAQENTARDGLSNTRTDRANPSSNRVERDSQVVSYTGQNTSRENESNSRESGQEVNQVSEATLHSGGADGADTAWDTIGKEFGLKNIKHYYQGEKNKYNAPNGNLKITQEDYEQGKYEVAKSAKRNWGYKYTTMKDSRLIRNWSQVKYADTVIAISTLVSKGEKIFPHQANDTRTATNPSVTGGTGYAVGMAIIHNKPVYVFNQEATKNYPIGWYKYDAQQNDFIPTQIPKLTKNFAGIGTRQINQAGKQAIKDVYAQVNSTEVSQNLYSKVNTFIDKALTDNDPVGELELFEVSQKEIDIAQTHGLNIRGLSHTINAHDIRHAIKVHGNDSSKGKNQENLTAEHLKRIPDVLRNFDNLEVQIRQGKNKSSLVYSKQFDDGKVVAVERAFTTSRDKKPRLSVKTVWVTSPISANQNTGKDITQVVYTPQGQNNNTTKYTINQLTKAVNNFGLADTAQGKLFNILVSKSSLNADVKFVLDDADGKSGYYNTATNTIHLSNNLPNNTAKLVVTNHELIHALTETGITKGGKAVDDLTAMYHQLVSKDDGTFAKQLENIYEFASYGLTDDKFAQFIANNLDLKALGIKPKNRLSNALEAFIRAMKSILGISTAYKTFYNTVLDSMVAYEPISNQTKRASDNVFSVLEDIQHKFNTNIDNMYTSLRSNPKPVSTSIPPVLLALDGKQGLSTPNLPLKLDKFTFKDDSSHNLTLADIKNLLPEIYDSIAVLVSDNKQGLTIITNMVKNNHEIIVPIHLNKTKGKYVVHDIASAFGKENFSTWFDKRLDKVIYYNPNKNLTSSTLPHLLGKLETSHVGVVDDVSASLNTKVAPTASKVNQSVATPDDIVKPLLSIYSMNLLAS